MLSDTKNRIIAALRTPVDQPIGREGAIWSWIRNGEFGSPHLLDVSDQEMGQAVTSLVREGRIEIMVHLYDLEIRLTV